MDTNTRIERALTRTLARYVRHDRPPKLCAALDYAIFPGGHRIRPRLCLAVAAACGDECPEVADAAAVTIELLHCASLVHDDLPIFDDSPLRRGKPSVHMAFGEPLALLVGDALIVMAFQSLAEAAQMEAGRLQALIGIIAGGVGMPCGIVAGQAWECEPESPLTEYHRQKTGALFAAATMAGAAAAGVPHDDWSQLGERIGEAYQTADDMLDRYGDPEVIGKPVGRDSELARPNSAAELGFSGVSRRLRRLVDAAAASIPACPGRAPLQSHIEQEALEFVQAALKPPLRGIVVKAVVCDAQ